MLASDWWLKVTSPSAVIYNAATKILSSDWLLIKGRHQIQSFDWLCKKDVTRHQNTGRHTSPKYWHLIGCL